MAVKLAVKLVVGLLGLLGLPGLLVLILWLVRYCKKRTMPLRSASPSTPLGSSMLSFTLDEVQVCTDDFSDKNLLGEGGFGLVYRGDLPNGKAVAVKRLKVGSRQEEREFETEINIISQVHHKHVVSLVGYCKTASERMLVYELVPNKTLEFHLHGEGQPTLDWRTRMKIALGSAKGLAYLHEDCHPEIIHCDIKAANILVDNEFEAKIADFGLAKHTSDANSHESTNVKGTFGYLAPEYISSGNLTEKSDVFSFGVVLLELITGCRAVGSTHNSVDNWLVNRARPQLTRALKDRNFGLLVDPKLQNNYRENEMTRMVGCAAACVHLLAEQRPTMSKIVRALEGDLPLSNLNDGITIFCGSSDCGTSHYSDPASERGLYPSGSSSMGPRRRTNWDLEMGRMERDSQGFSGGS